MALNYILFLLMTRESYKNTGPVTGTEVDTHTRFQLEFGSCAWLSVQVSALKEQTAKYDQKI